MKQKTKYIILTALVISFFALGPLARVAYADPPTGPVTCVDGVTPVDGKCPIANPAPAYLVTFTNFKEVLVLIINILLYFSGAIAVIFLVIGGYKYVASRGNEEAMESAKKTISSAVIGIVIILMAYAIVTIVNNIIVNKGP
ncbi:hypothetical protein D4R52_03675 [bacterium]|nr:MAG: hypothetical protein D4R52_03675 [bacterium]